MALARLRAKLWAGGVRFGLKGRFAEKCCRVCMRGQDQRWEFSEFCHFCFAPLLGVKPWDLHVVILGRSLGRPIVGPRMTWQMRIYGRWFCPFSDNGIEFHSALLLWAGVEHNRICWLQPQAVVIPRFGWIWATDNMLGSHPLLQNGFPLFIDERGY